MPCRESYYFHQFFEELGFREFEHQPFPNGNVTKPIQVPHVFLNHRFIFQGFETWLPLPSTQTKVIHKNAQILWDQLPKQVVYGFLKFRWSVLRSEREGSPPEQSHTSYDS
jgi:hypothetical protein